MVGHQLSARHEKSSIKVDYVGQELIDADARFTLFFPVVVRLQLLATKENVKKASQNFVHEVRPSDDFSHTYGLHFSRPPSKASRQNAFRKLQAVTEGMYITSPS